MKEYGVYAVKREYRDKFLATANKLAEMKIPYRPFVCVKLGGKNWLIPLSSINPESADYRQRFHKQVDYNIVDNQNPPKAMEIFSDVLNTKIRGFKNVAQYYNAIPVKHEYCSKYRNKQGEHIVVDERVGKKMKGQLINYIKALKENKLTGFIGKYVSEGRNTYRSYPMPSLELNKALYSRYIQVLRERKQKAAAKKERQSEREHKEELKRNVRAAARDLQQQEPVSRQQLTKEQQVKDVLKTCANKIEEECTSELQKRQEVEMQRQERQNRSETPRPVKPKSNAGKGRAK